MKSPFRCGLAGIHLPRFPFALGPWLTGLHLACGAGPEGASAPSSAPARSPALPVRAIHLSAPARQDLPEALRFIREVLGPRGVNTLILEFNYSYDFKSRPEFADAGALGREEVQQVAAACRPLGIELIPLLNCLGHQSWAKRNLALLTQHPEFDETPGKYPNNEGIYCRSYCPLHPEVHGVLFDLMTELAHACDAKSFHVGMDEVFLLADPDCPRCRGKDPAELFANEVKTLHRHLAAIGCRTWIWGDRFLDAKTTGLGKWEASENGTAPALDRVPKDLVICDWHYDAAPETPRFFAQRGFDVVVCPWRKAPVALAQLVQMRGLRADPDPIVARHALGLMQTTWCGLRPFVRAWAARVPNVTPAKEAAAEVAHCFQALSDAWRAPEK